MPKKIYVNFVLDETGSMEICRDATISGFNEFLQGMRGDQKDDDQEVRFTLTKFNSIRVEVVHDAVPLSEVKELTPNSYRPQELTPLYDAIMTTIHATEHAIEGQENVSVLCSIMTDGEENHSREHTREDVFKAIEKKTAEGWTFTYLAADQDAWAVGRSMGISQGNTMDYTGTALGTQSAMRGHTHSTGAWMAAGAPTTYSFYVKRDEDKEKTDA